VTPLSRTSAPTLPARLGRTPDDYTRIGIQPRAIKLWEDGRRSDGSPGTYEWWYFDAHLDDGAKLVVVFLTKEFTALKKPLSPVIRIDLTLPDGTAVQKVVELAAETFSASTETCDVRIGDNAFAGDLHTYTIRARVEDVEIDITLTGQVPAWCPETGHWLFGEEGDHYFAWLPSVPQGRVEATYRMGGNSRTVTGVGYQDHNWGNARCSTSCTTGTGRAARPAPTRSSPHTSPRRSATGTPRCRCSC
jgi:predicted secreted hydrolase